MIILYDEIVKMSERYYDIRHLHHYGLQKMNYILKEYIFHNLFRMI